MKVIIIFLWYIGHIISIIIPNWLIHQMYNVRIVLYSGWITRKIKKVDSSSRFCGDNIILGHEYIEIGKDCRFGKGSAITAFNVSHKQSNIIKVGSRCIFGDFNHITAANSIIIGNNLRTGTFVIITDNSHGDPKEEEELYKHPDDRPIYSKGGVVIGNNVWIGDKVSILPNCTIGDYCIIGANTVITHDVPAYSIAVGCPAKIYKR